jgi:hypothetical protein
LDMGVSDDLIPIGRHALSLPQPVDFIQAYYDAQKFPRRALLVFHNNSPCLIICSLVAPGYMYLNK